MRGQEEGKKMRFFTEKGKGVGKILKRLFFKNSSKRS